MGTKQITRFTVTSPSTVLHIVEAVFRGNDVTFRTHCGVIPQSLTRWERVYEANNHSKCRRCFPDAT
jgi:hypothetical protein